MNRDKALDTGTGRPLFDYTPRHLLM